MYWHGIKLFRPGGEIVTLCGREAWRRQHPHNHSNAFQTNAGHWLFARPQAAWNTIKCSGCAAALGFKSPADMPEHVKRPQPQLMHVHLIKEAFGWNAERRGLEVVTSCGKQGISEFDWAAYRYRSLGYGASWRAVDSPRWATCAECCAFAGIEEGTDPFTTPDIPLFQADDEPLTVSFAMETWLLTREGPDKWGARSVHLTVGPASWRKLWPLVMKAIGERQQEQLQQPQPMKAAQ